MAAQKVTIEEILELLAEGYSQAKAAKKLNIHTRSLERRLKRYKNKLKRPEFLEATVSGV